MTPDDETGGAPPAPPAPAQAVLALPLMTVRARRPLVHNLINPVAAELAAMALLAVGGRPVMAEGLDEIVPVAAASDAVTVNLGMPTDQRAEAMLRLADAAHRLGRPWVLDPVGVALTPSRRRLAGLLIDRAPSVIRGNADEIRALAPADTGASAPPATVGVDGDGDTGGALDAAARLARASGSVVAVTGIVDRVTDGRWVVSIGGGDPLMTRITGLGCALTCVVGAFLAVAGDDTLGAAATALATVATAGRIAAAGAAGPASLRTGLIDQLYRLDPARLVALAEVEQRRLGTEAAA